MDVVVARPLAENNDVPPGTRGVIEQVVSDSEGGSIYLVHLESGRDQYFVRAELRKPHAANVPGPKVPRCPSHRR